ncbi:MAG: hypothetical protein LBP54_08865 [Campylobacteraceae bacterium]|nr:hypothetical protein [Campylobacteraceae bacterium]
MERTKHIADYIKAVNRLYMQGITTEHSFRGDLAALFAKMTELAVINEARHIECGAPDLTLLRENIPVGFVEAKDIGKNLNSKEYKNQFDRYKKALDNLIITDYLTFQLFEGESFIAEVSIGKILPNKIEPLTENFNAFIEIIQSFSRYNGKILKDSKVLAEFMAAKTRLLAEAIEKTINAGDENNALNQQLQGFKEVLLSSMTSPQSQ